MPNPTYVRLDDNGLLYLLTLLKTDIENAGEDNLINIVKRNGVALSIDPSDKSVNVLVPTDSDIEALITAHGYQTEADVQQHSLCGRQWCFQWKWKHHKEQCF